MPTASIIIPCKNEGPYIKETIKSILTAKVGEDFELIVIDDGSVDGCCDFLSWDELPVRLLRTSGLGASQARNLGAEYSNSNVLVFCDGHVLVDDYWLDKLLGCFEDEKLGAISPGIGSVSSPSSIGYGQTWNERMEVQWLPYTSNLPHAVPLVPGGCMAVAKKIFREVNGFDRGFRVWGHEDEELSLKMWLFGYKVYVNSGVTVMHYFRKKHPYTVMPFHVEYNFYRMIFSHMSPAKIAKILRARGINHTEEAQALTEVIFSDVWSQRQQYLLKRKKTEQWFFSRFAIPI